MVSRPPASAALQRPGQGPQAAVSPAGQDWAEDTLLRNPQLPPML